MRITFVLPLPTLAGGVRVVCDYARRLQQRGHEVTVVAPAKPAPLPVARRARIWASDVKTRLRGGTPPDRRFRLPKSHVDDLGEIARRVPHGGPIRDEDVPDADIVISTWWETVPWVAALSPAKGRKVHFLQHDERAMTQVPAHARRIGEVSWRTPGFARMAVAEWIADVGRREFGVSDCAVLPNAIDGDLFNSEPRGRNQPPVAGMIHSEAGFKASEVALEAWRIARQEVPDLRLHCFGASEVAHIPLPPEARFEVAPAQHRLAEIYRSCDVWLFSSRCEGFGLPILEAMACGVPVVGTRTGAAPDLIDGSNGTLVDVDDAPALAKAAVDWATRDEASWRAGSDAARATAARHEYGPATDRFEAFLQSVA